MKTASKEFIPYTASSVIAQNNSVCWKVSIARQHDMDAVFLLNGESNPAYSNECYRKIEGQHSALTSCLLAETFNPLVQRISIYFLSVFICLVFF